MFFHASSEFSTMIRCHEGYEQNEAHFPVFIPLNDSSSELLSLGISLTYIITIATDVDALNIEHKIRFQHLHNDNVDNQSCRSDLKIKSNLPAV